VWEEKETRSFVAKTYWKAAIWNNENDKGGANSVAEVEVELGHVVVAALDVRVLTPREKCGVIN
jgi:hypothetical protein